MAIGVTDRHPLTSERMADVSGGAMIRVTEAMSKAEAERIKGVVDTVFAATWTFDSTRAVMNGAVTHPARIPVLANNWHLMGGDVAHFDYHPDVMAEWPVLPVFERSMNPQQTIAGYVPIWNAAAKALLPATTTDAARRKIPGVTTNPVELGWEKWYRNIMNVGGNPTDRQLRMRTELEQFRMDALNGHHPLALTSPWYWTKQYQMGMRQCHYMPMFNHPGHLYPSSVGDPSDLVLNAFGDYASWNAYRARILAVGKNPGGAGTPNHRGCVAANTMPKRNLTERDMHLRQNRCSDPERKEADDNAVDRTIVPPRPFALPPSVMDRTCLPDTLMPVLAMQRVAHVRNTCQIIHPELAFGANLTIGNTKRFANPEDAQLICRQCSSFNAARHGRDRDSRKTAEDVHGGQGPRWQPVVTGTPLHTPSWDTGVPHFRSAECAKVTIGRAYPNPGDLAHMLEIEHQHVYGVESCRMINEHISWCMFDRTMGQLPEEPWRMHNAQYARAWINIKARMLGQESIFDLASRASQPGNRWSKENEAHLEDNMPAFRVGPPGAVGRWLPAPVMVYCTAEQSPQITPLMTNARGTNHTGRYPPIRPGFGEMTRPSPNVVTTAEAVVAPFLSTSAVPLRVEIDLGCLNDVERMEHNPYLHVPRKGGMDTHDEVGPKVKHHGGRTPNGQLLMKPFPYCKINFYFENTLITTGVDAKNYIKVTPELYISMFGEAPVDRDVEPGAAFNAYDVALSDHLYWWRRYYNRAESYEQDVQAQLLAKLGTDVFEMSQAEELRGW